MNFVRDKPELVQCLRYRFLNPGGGGEHVVVVGGGGGGMPFGIQMMPMTTTNDATTTANSGGGEDDKKELPNENEVKGDMASMKQVNDRVKLQMMLPPETAWYGAVVYGNDGLIQLPRPSQLPKRERYGAKSGKKGGGGEGSPSRKKKKLETQSVVDVAV